MREAWAVGPEKRRRFRRRERPRPPRLPEIDWAWVVFLVLYLAGGAAVLWFVMQALEGAL